MTEQLIRKKIEENLLRAGIRAAEIRVVEGRTGGYFVGIVSEDFGARSEAESRALVLEGVDEEAIEWLALLTPEEREWGWGFPMDEPLETLPLWAETLARGSVQPRGVRFPSDEEEDLEPPLVVTFYSLRGGVGRSTALAYTARLLAAQRRRVLCVDMDLEAPGLAALFGCEEEVRSEQGVARLLLALDQAEEPDVAEHLVRVDEDQELYLVPAGKIGADYARWLALLDPQAWYHEERNPLRLLMEKLRAGLPFTPDVILLDARTGITPLSGPLLFELADMAIVVFFPHPRRGAGRSCWCAGSWHRTRIGVAIRSGAFLRSFASLFLPYRRGVMPSSGTCAGPPNGSPCGSREWRRTWNRGLRGPPRS